MSYFNVGDVVKMTRHALKFHRKHKLNNPGEFPCIVISRFRRTTTPGKCMVDLLCSKDSIIDAYAVDDFEIISKHQVVR